jgi:F-box and WD-40 domain protein CDC4
MPPLPTPSLDILDSESISDPNASIFSPHAHVNHHLDPRLVHSQRREMDEHGQDDAGQGPSSNDTFGQFSFAPATRTTVVTTTTTTTTSFPPLLIKPPRATKDLDARLYPLASTPTPANLRNLRFKLGDQSIVFNEPNDTTAAFTEVCSSSICFLGSVSQCSHIFLVKREKRCSQFFQRFDPLCELIYHRR